MKSAMVPQNKMQFGADRYFWRKSLISKNKATIYIYIYLYFFPLKNKNLSTLLIRF